MINDINRNHWIYIIKNLVSLIKNNIFIFVLLGINKRGIYYVGLFSVAIIVISILQWRKTIFYINDDLLVYEKGVISKSKEEIPFNKINTVDVGQTLLDGIFNVLTMKIDTGSAVAEKSELKIIGNEEYIKELKETILGSKKINPYEDEQDTENDIVDTSFKKVITNGEILKYALTKSKIGWALGGYFVLSNLLDDIGKFFDISFFKLVESNVNIEFIKAKSIIISIAILIVIAVVMYILITILSMLFELIRLYNFTIISNEKKISISYGILSKKEYSFNVDKIYGVRYKQSILQQILNVYTLEIITIGYGDEKDEKALLYPIADENFKNELIKKILPNICFEGELNRPPKSSLGRFILKKFVIGLIILIPAYMFIKIVPQNIKLVIVTLILSYCLISGYLNYINTSLGISNKSLTATTGAFLKTTTIISQDNLQSITKSQGIFQKMGRVCDYRIDLYSNKLGDILHVRHMREEVYDKLQENLIL